MFCPVCNAEYRRGFAKCSECDVDLVPDSPRGSPSQKRRCSPAHSDVSNDSPRLRTLYETSDEAECVALCSELRDANIFYRVAQEVVSRYIKMQVSWRYRIGVQPSDFDQAKKLLGIEDAANSPASNIEDDEEGCGDPSVELPDLPANDSANDERLRVGAYLKEWRPEDATVSIWRKSSQEDCAEGFERALTENLIHYRSVKQGREVRELFVLPEDESRASEIVREIKEGLPLS